MAIVSHGTALPSLAQLSCGLTEGTPYQHQLTVQEYQAVLGLVSAQHFVLWQG